MRIWRTWNSCALLVGMYDGTATVENNMAVPKKLKIELPNDPAIPFLSINPNELQERSRRDIRTSKFIVAWFTITKIYKQSKCPLKDEWINKIWPKHIQWNIIQPLKRKTFWHMLQYGWNSRTLLTEISQKQKDRYDCPYMTHLCVCLVMSDSLWPPRLQPARLLCPWNSPGKNTGVVWYSLLQGIFPIQGSNFHLHVTCSGREILYHLTTWAAHMTYLEQSNS